MDVSKRTEVTNNVRAASMRPKRRDRETETEIETGFLVLFFSVRFSFRFGGQVRPRRYSSRIYRSFGGFVSDVVDSDGRWWLVVDEGGKEKNT